MNWSTRLWTLVPRLLCLKSINFFGKSGKTKYKIKNVHAGERWIPWIIMLLNDSPYSLLETLTESLVYWDTKQDETSKMAGEDNKCEENLKSMKRNR